MINRGSPAGSVDEASLWPGHYCCQEFTLWLWEVIPEDLLGPLLRGHRETAEEGSRDQMESQAPGFCHREFHNVTMGSGRKVTFGTGTRLQLRLGR